MRCALSVAVLVAVLSPAPARPRTSRSSSASTAGRSTRRRPGLHLLQRDARPLGGLPGAEGRGARPLRARAPRAGGVSDARQHRREPGQPAPLPGRLRGAAPVRGHRGGAGAARRGLAATHPPDAPGGQRPLARGHASRLRDPARLRDAAAFLGARRPRRARLGAGRPRRRVPHERGRAPVRRTGRGAGDPEGDDGRDRRGPRPAAGPGGRALRLPRRGVEGRPPRGRSLHSRRRDALVELPLPRAEREPAALDLSRAAAAGPAARGLCGLASRR